MVNLYGSWDKFMELKINFEKLTDLMQAFYTITGIKIVIFDKSRNLICSYPDYCGDCAFCSMMKQNPVTAEKCAKDDIRSFNECKKKGSLIIYTCHAGLVEGCAPLRYNGEIIAYIMFGQISDLPSGEVLMQNVSAVCKENNLDESKFTEAAKDIKIKTYEDIMSAAKIFEACISYIILNEMLIPEHDKIIMESEKYISDNTDTVTVKSLYTHLNISRTTLYETFKEQTGLGVTEFIRNKQFEKAKQLLKETALPVSDIAAKCGFNDYNYFGRVFKKRYGTSPKAMRKSQGIL